MKKIIFPLLGLLMFAFSGCMDKGDNSATYRDIPAIVGYSSTFQPVITTSSGTFLAPELSSAMFTDLMSGDAIWTYFTINYDNQPSTEYSTVSELYWGKVGKNSPMATTGGESETGDYNTPIEGMGVYDIVGDVLFFLFGQTAPSDQAFVYEMTYDPDDTADIPTVYIRGRKSGTGSKAESSYTYPYAFDMSYYFMTHKESGKVKFYIKYKTGVDDEGNDKYSSWNNGNPFEITVE